MFAIYTVVTFLLFLPVLNRLLPLELHSYKWRCPAMWM